MSKHTPTPWQAVDSGRVLGRKNGPPAYDILATNPPDFVADRLTQANAEFIVRAVNSHDDLLAALKASMPVLHGHPDRTPGWHEMRRAAYDACRAAIAKAEVQP